MQPLSCLNATSSADAELVWIFAVALYCAAGQAVGIGEHMSAGLSTPAIGATVQPGLANANVFEVNVRLVAGFA